MQLLTILCTYIATLLGKKILASILLAKIAWQSSHTLFSMLYLSDYA